MPPAIDSPATGLAVQWAEAWNNHDMSVFETLVTEDADWVTVAGVHLRGRAQIQSTHVALHRDALAHTVWTNDTLEFAPLGPDVALAHLTWRVHSAAPLAGAPVPPRHGLFTWLLVRQHGQWRIRAAQGTNVAARATQASA